MQLKDFIKIYDNCLPPETVSSLIQWLGKQNFSDGTIDLNTVDKSVRNTKVLAFFDTSCGSQTRIHWCNLLSFIFMDKIKNYVNEVSKQNGVVQRLQTIDALQYEVGGHYKYHVDSGGANLRTISSILLLNNDYEGGELCFADPVNEEVYLKVKVIPGRLIVWPSNFLYPHAVTPITKGKRYSIVTWAL